MPGFMEGFANATAGNDIVQAGIDRGRQSKLQQLAAQYAQGGQPDYQGIAANGGDPMAFRNDAQNQKQARVKELSQYAGYLASLPAQARPQAYAALMPKLAPIGQELGLPPLPPAWDESHLPELQALSQIGMEPQQPETFSNAGNGFILGNRGTINQIPGYAEAAGALVGSA